MESVRRRVNIVLINKASQQKFQISKPGFKRFAIFDENLVGVELVKPVVELNKPIYVGATVLELSKLTMMHFFYKVFKPRFPEAELCFTGNNTSYKQGGRVIRGYIPVITASMEHNMLLFT